MSSRAVRLGGYVPLAVAAISMADVMVLHGSLLPDFAWGALLILAGMACAAVGRFGGMPDVHRPLHLVLMGALVLAMNSAEPNRATAASGGMGAMHTTALPLASVLLAACCVASCASIVAAVRARPTHSAAVRRGEHVAWAALMAGMVVAMSVPG